MTSPARPRLSLVVATLGRVKELDRLLASLSQQSWRDFDVTIVDQNDDDRLSGVARAPWPFPVQHLRTPGARGACRARNAGWRATTGQVVLFPDDDCWYPPQFLASGLQQLEDTGAQILTGRAADDQRRSINGRFELRPCSVTRANVWTTSIEWVAFFDRGALEALGGFDEGIGIGAQSPWQSCESQDIVLRALEAGMPCAYDPELFGHHKELNILEPDAPQIRKGRAYARGMGWVLRKHQTSWPRRAYWITRPLLKCVLRTLQRRTAAAIYYREIATGRFEGARGRLADATADKT